MRDTSTVIPLGDDALDRAVVGSQPVLADLDTVLTFAVKQGMLDGSTLCLGALPSEFVAAVVAVDPGVMRLAASDMRAAAGSEADWSDELRAQARYLQACWDGEGSEACVSSTLALAERIAAHDDSLHTRTAAVSRYASTVGNALAAMRRDLAAALLQAKQEDVAEVVAAAARMTADPREIINGDASDGTELRFKAGLRAALAVLATMTNTVTGHLDRLAALAREPDPYVDTPLKFPTFDVPDSPSGSQDSHGGVGCGPVAVAPRPSIPESPVEPGRPTECHGGHDGRGDSPGGDGVPDAARAEARVPDVPRSTPSTPSNVAAQASAPTAAGPSLEVAGAYVAAGLAVAVAAAVAVLLARRPVPRGSAGPASRRARNAVAARRAALARMVPPFGHTVHQAAPAPGAHPSSSRPPAVGVDLHGEIVDVSAFPGMVSLTGPGALASLRALAATLLAADPTQGRQPGMLVITKTDLGVLLGPQPVPEWLPPTLVLADSEAAALARIETEIVTRTRLLQDSGRSSLTQWRASAPDLAPPPAALIISCRREYAARLAAAARSGRSLDVWIIALPDGADTVTPPGTWYVDGEHHATAADTTGTGAAPPGGAPLRLHHLASTQLHDALSVLARAALPPRSIVLDRSPPAPAAMDSTPSASGAWPPRPYPSASGHRVDDDESTHPLRPDASPDPQSDEPPREPNEPDRAESRVPAESAQSPHASTATSTSDSTEDVAPAHGPESARQVGGGRVDPVAGMDGATLDVITALRHDHPAPVQIRLLGTPAAVTSAGPIRRGMRSSSFAVLAVLAAHPRGQNLEQIAAALYPEVEPSTAKARCRTAINACRKALREATGRHDEWFIVEEGRVYRIDPSICRVDLWEMLAAIHAANRTDEDDAALEALQRASDLYQGDFALTVDQPWAAELADRYRSAALDVWCRIAELTELDQPEVALAALESAVEHDPGNEPLWQHIMRIHGRLGRTEAVRRALRRCYEQLAEFGVKPSHTTRRVAERHLKPPDQPQDGS